MAGNSPILPVNPESRVPSLDAGVRQRLTLRFGDQVDGWFSELPGVLGILADRWQLELDSAIPRGSVAVVLRCRMSDGRAAVLKISPDRGRLAVEASALRRWTSVHTPAVLALDAQLGALLLEAIEPGAPLDTSLAYPTVGSIAGLLTSLHGGVPDSSYPGVAQRVAYLFESSAKLYQLQPQLTELVPPELYERGRRQAARLAHDGSPTVLLHGDLTPRNILDGGERRGLVAIDPSPCLGDAAFDAVDMLFWQAENVGTIRARATSLAPAIAVDVGRLTGWCTAFAGMTALELAGSPQTPPNRIDAAVQVASGALEA
jgi:streptomycin 6-kinase